MYMSATIIVQNLSINTNIGIRLNNFVYNKFQGRRQGGGGGGGAHVPPNAHIIVQDILGF
jgi:uncharacterized spore protein YtfJ